MLRRGAVTGEKYRVTQDSRSTLASNIGPFTPARCPRRISIGARRTETKLTEFMRRRCYKEIFRRNLRRIGAGTGPRNEIPRQLFRTHYCASEKFSRKLEPVFNIKKAIFLRRSLTHCLVEYTVHTSRRRAENLILVVSTRSNRDACRSAYKNAHEKHLKPDMSELLSRESNLNNKIASSLSPQNRLISTWTISNSRYSLYETRGTSIREFFSYLMVILDIPNVITQYKKIAF